MHPLEIEDILGLSVAVVVPCAALSFLSLSGCLPGKNIPTHDQEERSIVGFTSRTRASRENDSPRRRIYFRAYSWYMCGRLGYCDVLLRLHKESAHRIKKLMVLSRTLLCRRRFWTQIAVGCVGSETPSLKLSKPHTSFRQLSLSMPWVLYGAPDILILTTRQR
ncbi:hypothetical protein C8J57DRAFT_50375 [Mycena rebaudengoi]|nr:hypothetical protein C8J57DRAFT_50375 [Mycena rebaudengoi]